MTSQHLFSVSMLRMEGLLERQLTWPGDGAVLKPSLDMRQLFVDNIAVEGDLLRYEPQSVGRPGLYVGAEPVSPDRYYFEVELKGLGGGGDLLVGFLPPAMTRDVPSPWGCRVSQGKLWHGESGIPGVACAAGDRVGCGVRGPLGWDARGNLPSLVTLFVTHNGQEVGQSTALVWSQLHPAVSLQCVGQRVRLLGRDSLGVCTFNAEEVLMCVDSNEEDWLRLHDIRLNGPVLEYSGRGASMVDVGLAQTRCPLDTTSHYYEIEILDPGEKCCIAIGLAHKDYPKHRHPGWNKGSIAYHADDGKIFVGSGEGSRFGPRCQKGDVMGCGILFPRKYVEEEAPVEDRLDNSAWSLGGLEDEEEDGEDGCHCCRQRDDDADDPLEDGVLVEVFFTHNGVNVGRREVVLPQGGLYPTVGMLSLKEKVKVDLHPLTG